MHKQNGAHVAILGGGPAGLWSGYFAKKMHLPFTIFEARDRIGGNSVTFRYGDFYFDSGPHLLQTKDVKATNEIKELLQGELEELILPVQTYVDGRLVDFPFSPLDLFKTLGPCFFLRTVIDILIQRILPHRQYENFEDFAFRNYGKKMAKSCLLNYSEKLWGLPARSLSPKIGGHQLRGFNLATLFVEVTRGRAAKIERMGGRIYYPKGGFGKISEALGDFCGRDKIRTQSRVTSVFHDGHKIKSIELNGQEIVHTDAVLSTLPPNELVQLLQPGAPEEILRTARNLHFRSLIIVVVLLRRASVTAAASIHFPDPQLPFTRIHEPNKRCRSMSPDGLTSLVAEIPCQKDDETWSQQDSELIARVIEGLKHVHLISTDEVTSGTVVRLDNAYPVLDAKHDQLIQKIRDYLENFTNLRLTGRTGNFSYLSQHHILKSAKKTILSYSPVNASDRENSK